MRIKLNLAGGQIQTLVDRRWWKAFLCQVVSAEMYDPARDVKPILAPARQNRISRQVLNGANQVHTLENSTVSAKAFLRGLQ